MARLCVQRTASALALGLAAITCPGAASGRMPPQEAAPAAPTAAAPSLPPEEFAGCWQDLADPAHYVELEAGRLRELRGAELEFARVTYDVDHLLRRSWGRRERWELSFEQEDLVVVAPGRTMRLRKAPARPAALDPRPLGLGKAEPLAPERLAALAAEFKTRRDLDQAVRTDATRLHESERVDADNTAWLKRVVGEVGWIDVPRFGKDAAGAAFLLVQHSGDLPLMLAALPAIEQDMKEHGLDPQNYALLHDRLQIRLGRRQRYGSQIGQDEEGRQIVIGLEDRDRVDQFRKEIGLFPLKQYLAFFEQGVPPKKVLFEDDEPE